MLKDITLGQYFPGDTIVHRLDPRSKLILVVLYIAALFQASGWISYLTVTAATALCMILSHIRPKNIFKGLKPMLFIIVLTALLNLFYTGGREIVPGWHVTWEGLEKSVQMILRIVLLITGTFLLTYTTSPIALTDGLEMLLSPLKKIKVPVHEMTIMMSMALRFIPTLIEAHRAGEGPAADPGAAVRLGLPPRRRAGRRDGEPLLPRRRGPHAHEGAAFRRARLDRARTGRAVSGRADRDEEVGHMKNIALRLTYDGSRYHGWQTQKKEITVQQTLEEAIEKCCGERRHATGCGRTDAGVHALRYCANFKSDCRIPPEKLPLALNSCLPSDIAVLAACEVGEDFNAIGSCIKKEYIYKIHNSNLRDPFLEKRACFYPQRLDVEKMNAAARAFEGTHDFAAVRSVGTETKTTVRTVYWCSAQREGDLITVRVCANGFLYNMARAMVGTMVYASYGKLEPEEIPALLEKGDRRLTGPTMPAQGLYLNRLWYDGPAGKMMEEEI